jgi:hypothetical protein
MLGFVNSFMSWNLKKRIPVMEFAFTNGAAIQEGIFLDLINEGKKTAFGKEFDFKSIASIADYQRQVPLFHYDNMKPYIDRLMNGEQNVLWSGEINWFAKSSGTTSDKSKFIPVSYDALEDCQFRGSRDVLAWYYYHNPDAKLFQGKGLIIGGSHEVNALAENSYYGDLSAVMMNNMPFIASFLATPSLEIALLPEWETKMAKMVDATSQENVTNISGVPSWTLLLLRAILEKTGAKSILEVWPNLELYVHGGVNFAPYKEQFDKIMGGPIAYRETYNASEGFIGLQIAAGEDLTLMLDYGIFYEFIPMSEYRTENPKTLWIDEVEENVEYAVVITTNAGLWRYIIGDTMSFTHKNPYRFKITGRTASYINAFGEELMVHNAETAITIAQKICNCEVSEFTAAPVYLAGDSKGRHQWAIEFTKMPKSVSEFAGVLDLELQKTNSDYEAKRRGEMALEQLEVISCAPNTFYDWLKINKKLGGQHKIPKLCNHRKVIEEILKINKNE